MYLTLLIQLEVLLMNLVLTDLLSTRKYKIKTTVISLVLFTFLTVSLFFFLRTDNTPELFHLIVGFSFIFPLSALYKDTILKMSTIMFFCWTQTMIISIISKSLAFIINGDIAMLYLIIQTVLLIIAFPFIRIFAKKTFKVIIKGISNKSFMLLFALASLLLSTTIILGYFFERSFIVIVSLILLGITNIIVYILLRDFVMQSDRVLSLNKIAFTDSLTKLENRFSLFTAVDILIEQNIPFHCIYMDLDDLKEVNDSYGHIVGDKYLQCFANADKNCISKNSTFYRIAGDEFVCITKDVNIDIDEFKSQIESRFKFIYDFKGVSIGSSTFLKDGKTIEDLLVVADSKMYNSKQKRKFRLNQRKYAR